MKGKSMAFIDDIREDLRKRANDFVRDQLGAGGAPIPGFGVAPMLVVAALGTRTDDTGIVNTTPQPINAKLVDQVLAQAAGQLPVPIKPDEAKRVLALLQSGQFHNDIAQGIRELLIFLQVAPRSAIQTLLQAPSLPTDLVQAVSADLVEELNEGSVRAFLVNAKDGKIDDPPNFLRNTLRVVLALATPHAVIETLRELIAPDNETFRLALIIYARSQGIDLTPEDLDALRKALDPAAPNLGVLFGRGLAYVRRRTGGPNEAADIVQRLGFLNPTDP
jgi:hypothetical protein